MRCYWFAFTLVLTLQAIAQSADPWLVVPGKSVGPITARSTPAQLKRLYAPSQLKDRMVSSGGDAEPELATVINHDDPTTALTVFWNKPGKEPHPTATAHPDSINLCYSDGKASETCKWHLANSVSFGTSLRELERLNGRPFQLAGFEWDYSGMVTNWNGGNLQHSWNSCGQVLLRLQPRYAATGPTAQQQKLYQQVMGDGNFLSSNPAMQQLNPIVYAITVKLPETGNCTAN